jgi:GNAT superfamily N-acetyltransferase
VLNIRPATLEDLPVILDLIRGLADYERLLNQVEADEAALQSALFGAQPRVFCDLAQWHDAASDTPSVAGFALWFYNFSTFRGRHGLYLEDLFVKPEQRGRGIGRALLAHLAQRCVAENLGRFEWAVLDWNRPARDFYESLGARPLKEWIVHRVDGEALARLAARS